MYTLQDKSIVITGAASGIGHALAHACAQRGARLLLADIDAAGLQALSQELKTSPGAVHICVTDTGDEAAIAALALRAQELFGAADVLVNNAGVALVSPLEAVSTADAQWLMNINFWGVAHGCRAFAAQLRTRPEACVVNISSIFAMVSMPTQGMYNASKAAVRAYSDSLREELRGTSVRVLCVHPGGIATQIANRARVVDASLIAKDALSMRQQFDHAARTTPAQAAAAIVRAIEQRKTRLLIGGDAVLLDAIFRLFPSRASQWMTALSRWEARRKGLGV
jgi:NADP-dependent 3-hydroxy acid dehydrogenase YdfG